MNHEDLENGKLIKEALLIVDKLADSDLIDVMDGVEFNANNFDYEMLQKLIKKARRLKQNKFWKLT